MLVYGLGEKKTKLVFLFMVFQFMQIPILMVVILIKANLIPVMHKKFLKHLHLIISEISLLFVLYDLAYVLDNTIK